MLQIIIKTQLLQQQNKDAAAALCSSLPTRVPAAACHQKGGEARGANWIPVQVYMYENLYINIAPGLLLAKLIYSGPGSSRERAACPPPLRWMCIYWRALRIAAGPVARPTNHHR